MNYRLKMPKEKPNAGIVCPRCGSENIRKLGHVITQRGRQQRLQCEFGHCFAPLNQYSVNHANRKF